MHGGLHRDGLSRWRPCDSSRAASCGRLAQAAAINRCTHPMLSLRDGRLGHMQCASCAGGYALRVVSFGVAVYFSSGYSAGTVRCVRKEIAVVYGTFMLCTGLCVHVLLAHTRTPYCAPPNSSRALARDQLHRRECRRATGPHLRWHLPVWVGFSRSHQRDHVAVRRTHTVCSCAGQVR